MYHPGAATAEERAISPITADYEFIELNNRGDTPIDLRDLRFTGGIKFSFATSAFEVLEPGEPIVLVRNRGAFATRYPNAVIKIAGCWGKDRLSDKGESVVLSFGWHTALLRVDYDDKGNWPQQADGKGASLELKGATWSASSVDGGSPGTL